MAQEYGPQPAPTGGDSSFLGLSTDQMQGFGTAMAVGGVLTSAIGAYFSSEAQRYSLKSQALDLDFRKSMANLNAKAAERDAALTLQAGQREAGRLGLQYRQAMGSMKAATGARGVQAGVGSQAEAEVSVEYAKELDMITINANAVRAANALRARAVGFQNEARMAGVSAANLRRQAGTISPYLSVGQSLLSSAGSFAGDWAAMERQSARYRYSGTQG